MAKKTLRSLPKPAKPAAIPAVPGGGPVVPVDSVYADIALGESLIRIPLDQITPNPDQPRKVFDKDALTRLANSIADRGLIQPIVVRKLGHERYELIAGERRWRASRLAGLADLPAILRDRPPSESALDALAENLDREDLNPVEEARALAALVDGHGMTPTSIAKRMNRSRPAIANSIRLLELPDTVLDHLSAGRLTARHGRTLLSEPDHTTRRKLADRAAADGWTVHRLEAAIKAPSSKAAKPTAASDHLAVAEQAADRLSRTSGFETTVKPRGTTGFRITIDVDDANALDAYAKRLGKAN